MQYIYFLCRLLLNDEIGCLTRGRLLLKVEQNCVLEYLGELLKQMFA